MKSQYLKVLFIEFFLVLFSFFHFIFLKQFSVSLYVLEVGFIYLMLNIMLKTDKRESHLNKYFLLLILIICLAYYAITYTVGFFVGFIKTTYSQSLTGILTNVSLSTILVLLLENIREIIIQQGRYYKSLVFLSVFPLVMMELLYSIALINFTNRVIILQIILVLIIPCIFRNIFLTYSTFYFGKYGSILYHLFMAVIPFVLPVFPNFSDYINTLISVITPILLLYFSLNYVFVKNDKIVDAPKYYKSLGMEKAFLVGIIIVLLSLIYLISNVGRFTIMAIGSESMKGSIDKGDVVFLDKKDRTYHKGDIIAFIYEGRTVVHRIVDINNGEDTTYVTKGDANNNKDTWLVKEKDIIAKSEFKIKYLGWPTVLLSEYLSKDKVTDNEG